MVKLATVKQRFSTLFMLQTPNTCICGEKWILITFTYLETGINTL